ncbi:MAG: recombinase family protein [Dehalococcoidia bacterium]
MMTESISSIYTSKGEGQSGQVRRVALVVRVSTDRQAMTPEGSLKNQLQRLRAHIEYKTVACGEQWQETSVYELRAVSGKDSMRSQEFQQLFRDIRSGRVNTVLRPVLFALPDPGQRTLLDEAPLAEDGENPRQDD